MLEAVRYSTSTLKCFLSPRADNIKRSVFSQNCGLVRTFRVGVVNVGKDKCPSCFFIGTNTALNWGVVRNSHPRHIKTQRCCTEYHSFCAYPANASGCYCLSCKSVKHAQAHERKMYEHSFTGSPSLSTHQRLKTQVVCVI